MAQAISSSSNGSDESHQSLSTIPLTSSEDSSLVSSTDTRRATPPVESLTTDLPLVAINYSGTSPITDLPQLSCSKSPSFKASKPHIRTFVGRDAVFGPVEVSKASDLVIPPNRNSGSWKVQNLREATEGGSYLGLVNVSPTTYTASPLASPTEEKFAIATQHLRQHSDVVAKAEAAKTPKQERQTSPEREDSEEVIVVPDLRPREESVADQRRRRRRFERRRSAANASIVSPEVIQRG